MNERLVTRFVIKGNKNGIANVQQYIHSFFSSSGLDKTLEENGCLLTVEWNTERKDIGMI